MIVGTRLRGGNANTARGASRFAARAISTARSAGCTDIIVVRMDSGYYNAAACHAVRRVGGCFSVTAKMDPAVTAAITAIPVDAWTPIRYPQAIWDDQLGCWVSDAEIAETSYTAFASKKSKASSARLIVRRVRDQPTKAAAGTGQLFSVWAPPSRLHRLPSSQTPLSPCSRPRNSTAVTPSSNSSGGLGRGPAGPPAI